MGKRERVEDLGKLSIMLDNILDHEIFENTMWHRAKDSHDIFFSLDENTQSESIRNFAYGLDYIKEKIYECLSIANGQSESNI